jgi:O-antigen/teichoic acid export membrane protein
MIRALAKLSARQERSLVSGVLVTVLFNVGSSAIMGLSSILVARALGPREYGLSMWFITGTGTVALAADVIGLRFSSTYLVASGRHGTDLGTVRSTVVLYGLVCGAIAGCLCVLINQVRAAVFPGFAGGTWVALLLASIIGLSLMTQVRGELQGERRFVALGGMSLLSSAVYCGAAVFVVRSLAWRRATHVALAYLVAAWFCIAVWLIAVTFKGWRAPSIKYLRKCSAVGMRAMAVNWVSFLHMRADQYLVHLWLGPQALGLYSASVTLGELLTQIPKMVGNVLFTSVAAEPDALKASHDTLRRAAISMAIVAVIALPVAAAAPKLVALVYGAEYLEASAPLRLLLPGIVCLAGLLLVTSHLGGMGYPPALLYALVAGVAANIGLNICLIRQMGISGASVSSSITYGLQLAIEMWYLLRNTDEAKTPRLALGTVE